MVMRRITSEESDPTDKRRTRVKHRYVDMPGGERSLPVGIGGGPGSRAAERGDLAPGEPAIGAVAAASSDGQPGAGGRRLSDATIDGLARSMVDMQRAGPAVTIGGAIDDDQAREVERRVGELLEQERAGDRERLAKAQQRERELMQRIDKLEKDVSELSRRVQQSETETVRVRDQLAQISADHGRKIEEIELALGMLGEDLAKDAAG